MENQPVPFQFKADGFELFKIYIVNMLLSAITLGIYSFWARVKVTKFLFQSTHFLEETFDFHGTGKEKFIGFLKGMGIVGGIFLVLMILSILLGSFLSPVTTQVIITLLTYAIIIAFVPLILIGSHRYLLSRTSYRGIRFRFAGLVGDIYKELLIGMLLLIVTMGLYWPWFFNKYNSFLTNNSHYGNESFRFEANPKELFRIMIKGYLLSILTFGIYSFWFEAELHRFIVNHTSFQGKQLQSELTGGKLFKVTILSLLMVGASMGLAMPWAVILQMEAIIGSMSMQEAPDFSNIQAEHDAGASALADGISEAAEALDAVSGIFT